MITNYRADIDGLRAFAVLAVITYHTFPNVVRGGFIGVDIFFVISGYIITLNLIKNLNNKNFNILDFYSRRILRIFPTLITILICTFIIGWYTLLDDEFYQLNHHIFASTVFVSNIILWREVGYFDNLSIAKPLLHLWSLAIEEQFYLIWPIILFVLYKVKINISIVLFLLITSSFYLNITQIRTHTSDVFYFPHTRFWELLVGCLIAINSFKVHHSLLMFRLNINNYGIKLNLKRNIAQFFNSLSIIGFVILLYGLWRLNNIDFQYPGKWAIIPVLGTTLILCSYRRSWFNRKILSNKYLVKIGLISYPLYLWHWPLISYVFIVKKNEPNIYLSISIIILAIFLAWITYILIELPIRYGIHKFTNVFFLLLIMFCISLASFLITNSKVFNSITLNRNLVDRKELKYVFGDGTLAFIKGKEDWLFLGNAYNDTIAKSILDIKPSDKQLKDDKLLFSEIAKVSKEHNIKTILLIGPDKHSIYKEYLPFDIHQQKHRYIDIYLENLTDIINLNIYDPTNDLLLHKNEGLLYYRSDSHWNYKGSYIAFKNLLKILKINGPIIDLKMGSYYSGDLIAISKNKDFPLHIGDNWIINFNQRQSYFEKLISSDQKNNFDINTVNIINQKPLVDKSIWVIGDSFVSGLKPYINTTFQDVIYIPKASKGELKKLPQMIKLSETKPDFILIVKVERSF